MNKEIKDLIREITANGWIVTQGRTHFKAKKPGCGIVSISVSPNGQRAVKNARADIRRAERNAPRAHHAGGEASSVSSPKRPRPQR